MKDKLKVAFLPLYIALYDEVVPEIRESLETYVTRIQDALTGLGVDVERLPICRVREEFSQALAGVEKLEPDLLVCLHLAYSPSEEALEALLGTDLPLLLLDTTPDAAFDQDTDPARILFNHGIHGVQDLACMLRRKGRDFEIVAGHYENPRVLSRAVSIIRGAHMARSLRSTRVVRVGHAFQGMGDFSVDESVLRERFGLEISEVSVDALSRFVREVSPDAVKNEMERNHSSYDVDVSDETHERSVRVGLGLRAFLEAEKTDAFSANFQCFQSGEGPVDTVPFLEISKAMSRGIGYAGEGDVLTASLVAALLSAFEKTTFTEMFCPDWQGNAVFLSHMGEINPAVLKERPRLCEKEFRFGGAKNPAVITGAMREGPAVLVNLAPGPDDTFGLLVVPCEVLEDTRHEQMRDAIRGWVRFSLDLEDLLESYSRHGGTHHSALVWGDQADAMMAFGKFMGLDVRRLG